MKETAHPSDNISHQVNARLARLESTVAELGYREDENELREEWLLTLAEEKLCRYEVSAWWCWG